MAIQKLFLLSTCKIFAFMELKGGKFWTILFFSRSCSVFVRMNSRTFFPSSNDAGMNFLARSTARAGEFVAIHVLKPKILGKEKNSNIDIDYLWTVDT